MNKFIRNIIKTFVPVKVAEYIINRLVSFYPIDLYRLLYTNNGILKYQNMDVSGESYFLENYIKPFCRERQGVVFDIGANKGHYTQLLASLLPETPVHAFEANSFAFQLLVNNTRHLNNVISHNLGLSNRCERSALFVDKSDLSTEHGSLYVDALCDFYAETLLEEVACELVTIDSFCQKQGLSHISFMKIDTEGHDIFVLKGAADMINSKSIDIIQFEFNDFCVASRVFIKDFFVLLSDYELFRLDTSRLIRLNQYDTKYELFKYQNIISIHKSVISGFSIRF